MRLGIVLLPLERRSKSNGRPRHDPVSGCGGGFPSVRLLPMGAIVLALTAVLGTLQFLLEAAPDQRLDLADVLFLLDAADRFDDRHEIARQGNAVVLGALPLGGAG